MSRKILVIGCGSIGARHAGNAAKRAAVAVVDTDQARAGQVAAANDGQAFPDVATALAWNPDVAIIATPPKFHLAMAGELVAAGVPVLIEKPISPSLDGVDALLEDRKSVV